jgi:hypothetical protein
MHLLFCKLPYDYARRDALIACKLPNSLFREIALVHESGKIVRGNEKCRSAPVPSSTATGASGIFDSPNASSTIVADRHRSSYATLDRGCDTDCSNPTHQVFLSGATMGATKRANVREPKDPETQGRLSRNGQVRSGESRQRQTH